MSLAQYAKTRGADRKTIRRQVQKGVIARDAGGRIDAAQADAAWGRVRRARRPGASPPPTLPAASAAPEGEPAALDGAAGRRSANAKIAAAVASLRLEQARLADEQARYADRAEAIRIAGIEADWVLATLRQAPARHAPAAAAALGLPAARARGLLRRFMTLALGEIGDLRGEAIRAAEAA